MNVRQKLPDPIADLSDLCSEVLIEAATHAALGDLLDRAECAA
jgi:hypothetical protein